MRVPYPNVIKPDEYNQYSSVVDSEIVRVLPQHNRVESDPCDNLGNSAREIQPTCYMKDAQNRIKRSSPHQN